MPYRLTNDLRFLLAWLVVNFPHGWLKAHLFERSLRIADFNGRIPEIFNRANLVDLDKAELIIFRSQSKTVTALQGRAINQAATWEVEILPAARELVANDFEETAISRKEGWVAVEINLPRLVVFITQRFDHDELDSLCLDLVVNKDELGDRSTPISERVERLAKLMIQNGRFDKLVQSLEAKRPGTISGLDLFLP